MCTTAYAHGLTHLFAPFLIARLCEYTYHRLPRPTSSMSVGTTYNTSSSCHNATDRWITVGYLWTVLAAKILRDAVPRMWQTHCLRVVKAYHANFVWFIDCPRH